MRVFELAGRSEDPDLAERFARLDPAAPRDYRELAALVAAEWHGDGAALIGLGGGQGAGKSTLSHLLAAAFEDRGERAEVLSLDDFYLTKEERRALGQGVHPLFETRGAPGTHDVGLLAERIDALLRPGRVSLPVFDKGIDDRVSDRSVEGGCDRVILEGWCVGARALPDDGLREAINALESERDPEGVWRRAANSALAERYVPLFERLDRWIFLAVPNLEAVRRWRLQQESERPPERRWSREQVDRFVQHYERTTLAMLADAPERASLCVELDDEHRVAGLRFAKRGRGES